jgi:hypothetical protein
MSAFSDRVREQKSKGFYKVADLEGGKEVTHTIDYLDEQVEMFGKTMDILNFSDTARQLQLNITNAEILLEAFGDRAANLEGQGGDALSRRVRIQRREEARHPPEAGRRCRRRGQCQTRDRSAGRRQGRHERRHPLLKMTSRRRVQSDMDRLAPDALERLIKLLGMLGSAHDGERAAAGLKAHDLIRRHGLTWSDILATSPKPIGWRDQLAACSAHKHSLNERERAFVFQLARWRGTPTEKQLAWLQRIYENLP